MQDIIKNYTQTTKPKYAVIAVLMASMVFAILGLLQAVIKQIWRSTSSTHTNKNGVRYTKPTLSRVTIMVRYVYAHACIQLQAITEQIWRYCIAHTAPKYRLTAMVCRHLCMAIPMWLQAVTRQICKREINKNNCKKPLTNKLMYDRIISRKTDTTENFRVFVGVAIHI